MAIDPVSLGMAGAGLVSGAMSGLDIGGNRLRRKQVEQQQKLTNQQVAANKELANHGMGISKEMFEYTGYGAQRRQMEEAGLNPALMYGHAGSGGQTASASAGSAGMGQASDEASQKMARTQAQGMALQMAKLKSEIDINKAQARNLNVDANKKEGPDTELVLANIKDITQGIKNKEAQEAGQNLQNDYDKLRNYIKENTLNYDIGYIGYMAGQARENWQMLINNREISDEIKDDIVKNYELMNKNILVDMMLKDKQAKLSEEQAKKAAEDVLQGWKDLDIKEKQGDRKLDIDEKTNKIKERFPSVNQFGGALLQNLFLWLDKIDPSSTGEWSN